MKRRPNQQEQGFSIIELVIVVAIILIVSAIAVPRVMDAIYNVRLRSSAYTLSGLIQTARAQAIRDNSYYYVCNGQVSGVWMGWVSSSCGSAPAAGEPQVQLGGNVRIATSGQPSGLNATSLGFNPQPTSVRPSFNARGLPCLVQSGRCLTTFAVGGVGNLTPAFQMYLTDTRAIGSNGWSAVIVSPAGRGEVWSYYGSNWGK